MPNSRHRYNLRRKISFALAIGAAAMVSMMAVPSALASTGRTVNPPVYCQSGQGYNHWSKMAKPWKVLHELRVEHFVHGKGRVKEQVKEVASVTAAVKFEIGDQATFGIDEIASLGGHLDLSLEAKGKRTDTKSIEIVQWLNRYTTYIFYDGTRRATGILSHYICHDQKSYVRNGKATVTSWNEPTIGVLDCKTKPPKSSLGATVKRLYC